MSRTRSQLRLPKRPPGPARTSSRAALVVLVALLAAPLLGTVHRGLEPARGSVPQLRADAAPTQGATALADTEASPQAPHAPLPPHHDAADCPVCDQLLRASAAAVAAAPELATGGAGIRSPAPADPLTPALAGLFPASPPRAPPFAG